VPFPVTLSDHSYKRHQKKVIKLRKDRAADGRSRGSKAARRAQKAQKEKREQSRQPEVNMTGILATVGILSIGSMGAGVARLLAAHNYRVITNASDRR
jgi:lactate dehydrogenase-like 2-hydroxyacid dehydrogenase